MQFMSIERLANCLRYGLSGYPPLYVPVAHATHHDLESLVWVTEYALFRRAYHNVLNRLPNDPMRKHIEQAFRTEFGCVTAAATKDRRTATAQDSETSPLPGMLQYFDKKLDTLVPIMQVMVIRQNPITTRKEYLDAYPLDDMSPQPKKLMTCDAFEAMLKHYASKNAITL